MSTDRPRRTRRDVGEQKEENESDAGVVSSSFPLQAHANKAVMLNCIIYGDNSGIIITGFKLNYITISITKWLVKLSKQITALANERC